MEEQRHANSTKKRQTVVNATKSYINNNYKKAVLKSAYKGKQQVMD
ncbi:ATP phosphoribosyltransferase catalytic subunit [Crocosphaera chwakensis CCY0110]|uniref:ATP phosphoribosyltransferase catalytic subunit n=1 Tax=Crocosphaera chwakensis CCY0110 TaxID=391612 RepID=A3IMB7_9CHRO|nr:ATP phosphoribosyltransferase catalytic subunit [Crocosphaera chwakensis CCY0110]